MSKVSELLQSGSYPDISWSPVDSPLNSESKLYSPTPTFTWKCLLIQTIKENLLFLVGAFLSATTIYVKVRQWRASCRYGRITKELYGEILSDLKQFGGRTQGLTQNDILRKFLNGQYPGVKLDEYTFNTSIWPQLEALRKKDKKVNSFQRQEFGKLTNVW